jgi:hypothetical protein
MRTEVEIRSLHSAHILTDDELGQVGALETLGVGKVIVELNIGAH